MAPGGHGAQRQRRRIQHNHDLVFGMPTAEKVSPNSVHAHHEETRKRKEDGQRVGERGAEGAGEEAKERGRSARERTW